MRPEGRDKALLWDMQEAAKEIVEFVQDQNFAGFSGDKKLRYAIERLLLIIGEAASKVSSEFKEQHPEIPWKSIVGQRHVLAHEYGEVLVERVWQTASKSVPELLILLEPLVPESPQED